MDKLAIVIGNYIDVDCDAKMTPRQAYELGFRRATEKCGTVMHSTKVKNDQLKAENAKLRELLHDVLRHYTFSGIPKTCEESIKMAHEEFELGVRAHELGIDF